MEKGIISLQHMLEIRQSLCFSRSTIILSVFEEIAEDVIENIMYADRLSPRLSLNLHANHIVPFVDED